MRVWRTNDVAAAVGLLGRAVALLPLGEVRAELLWERSIALRVRRRPGESADSLARAGQDAADAGATGISLRVEAERAYQRLNAGDLALADALATFTRVADGLRKRHDSRGLGRTGMFLCNVHHLACRYDEVLDAARRAEPSYAEAGFSPAVCIGTQAESMFYGPRPVAVALHECAALLDRCSDRAARAWVTAVIGGLRGLEGNFDDGRFLLAEARTTFEELGNERAVLTVWTPLAVELESLAGDGAEPFARSSFESLRDADDAAYATTHAVVLAEFLVARGEDEEADELCRFAEEEALDSDVFVQFRWRSLRAVLLARSGDLEAAERAARDAVAVSAHTDALRDRARTHVALAEVLRRKGNQTAADTEIAAARDLLHEKGATAVLARHRAPVSAKR